MSLSGTHVIGDTGHTADHNTIDTTLTTHTSQIAALSATSGTSIPVQGTAPSSPTSGSLWIDTSTVAVGMFDGGSPADTYLVSSLAVDGGTP